MGNGEVDRHRSGVMKEA